MKTNDALDSRQSFLKRESMNPLRSLALRTTSLFGLKVSRRDRLEDQIPGDYLRSPFLPCVYRQSMGRLFYFRHMFDRIQDLPGEIVECGVSTGHGILYWALLCELTNTKRQINGFDSFAGFPPSIAADEKADRTFQTAKGDYSTPPEMVLRVLNDGRVSPEFVKNHVRLVRGFFDQTLSHFRGSIALLHLDCDLYESYHTCLAGLYDRVVAGGIIMFDEYEDRNFPGAQKAIDEFFANKAEKPRVYHELGYQKHFVVKA